MIIHSCHEFSLGREKISLLWALTQMFEVSLFLAIFAFHWHNNNSQLAWEGQKYSNPMRH